MAEKLINTIIQVRRDTQANWTAVASEFIPKEGEPCLTLGALLNILAVIFL